MDSIQSAGVTEWNKSMKFLLYRHLKTCSNKIKSTTLMMWEFKRWPITRQDRCKKSKPGNEKLAQTFSLRYLFAGNTGCRDRWQRQWNSMREKDVKVAWQWRHHQRKAINSASNGRNDRAICCDSYNSHWSNHLPHNWAEKTDGPNQPHKYYGGAGTWKRKREPWKKKQMKVERSRVKSASS